MHWDIRLKMLYRCGLRAFACMLFLACCPSLRADNYDTMRAQWIAIQVGATNDTSDADVSASLSTTASTANTYWTSMNTASGATYLWSDLTDFTKSATIDACFGRLKAMAMAYAQPGGSLQGNTSLAQAVTYGLDWLYTNYYNQNTAMFDNWWDWQIGDAQALMTTALLVYDQLTSTEIANYTAAIDHFDANPSYWHTVSGTQETATGANLTDLCLAVILRGVLGKTSAKITAGESALAPAYLYVTSGDGFYVDGSFVQHTTVAYTGSYGAVLLGDIANLFLLLNNSAWPITDSNAANVWTWVSQSYAPLIYNGATMDMVSGRAISRCGTWDHGTGRGMITSLLRLSYGASPSEAAYIQGLVKAWVTNDTTWNGYTNPCNGPGSTLPSNPVSVTYNDYYSKLSPFDIANYKSVMNNASITAASALVGNYSFAGMQRVVHLRPGFGFGLSLFSKKISAFECGNGENLQGWYTGLGMTYLYTADLGQYSNNYWATVNPLRPAGVTTDSSTKTPKCAFESYLNTNSWVGGSVVDGLYGSTGIQFTLSPVTGSTLSGQKSWFWFANKMVALGTGINSTSSGAAETIVDNRMLNANGNNALIVNGTAQSTTLGWSSTLSNISWAYLDGNASNSGIGYYFPGTATVYGLRESRTGRWSSVNTGGPTTQYTNNFLSLAFEHGTSPTNAAYAYVVLPNQTSSSMAAYAASPDIVVLDNSTTVQAVVDTSLNAVGANFWTNTSTTVYDQNGAAYLTSPQQASVTTVQNGNELDVAVSDPTQANTGTIQLTIGRSASSIISADSAVTVTRLSPTIALSVNVNGAAGKSFSVKFNLNTSSATSLSDVADAYVQNGTYANTNYGTASYLTVKNDGTGYFRNSYLKFNLSSITSPIKKATVYLVAVSEGASGFTNQAILVTNNSWTETGITWNSAPPMSTTLLGSWAVPATGSQVGFDVTAQALSAQSNGNLLSIGITSPTNAGSTAWVEYGSKENGTTAYRPMLVVNTQ